METIINGVLTNSYAEGHYTVPHRVRVIDDSAFYDCKHLLSVTLSNSVTTIGNSAFFGCRALVSVTLPPSLSTIGFWAFAGCLFASVTIPPSVTRIDPWAFSTCTALTSVTIAGSTTGIHGGAFSECNRINRFNISEARVNEADDNGQTLLARCVASLQRTPENVIQALIEAGASIDNIVIPTTRAAGLGARMEAWREQYELREYRRTTQALLDATTGCQAGFGPSSPITTLPQELIRDICFNAKHLSWYPRVTQAHLDEIKDEMLDTSRVSHQKGRLLYRNARHSVLNNGHPNRVLDILFRYGMKQAQEARDTARFQAWKDAKGTTAIVPYASPKL